MSTHGRPGGGRGSDGGRHAPARFGSQTVKKLWPDYLDGGYFDAQGNLKPEYVSREKMERLVKAMCLDDDQPRRDGLTSHQVRRYFGHCRAIETRLKSATDTTWASVVPEIKKLDIAAADGFAKKPSKIPDLFHDFVKCNVAAIKSREDFLNGFLPHFEALVGFGTAHFRKERS
jgi:CRISPR type III-A-associated protein Csm2